MEINKVLEGLDYLFQTYQIKEVEGYLTTHMELANEEGDGHSYITLLNEMIGYCRDTSQYEKAVSYCKLALAEIDKQGLTGSVAHATTLLNVANAYRAASLLEESMQCYQAVFPIYDNNLDKNDFRYASLANNMSLLYQEMGDFGNACRCLEKALSIVQLYPEARIELAVTYTNLAMSQVKLNEDARAEGNLQKAFEIFNRDEEKDYHYSAALSAMAEVQYKKGAASKTVEYYEEALTEIEKHVGRTQAYEVVKQNKEKIEKELAVANTIKNHEAAKRPNEESCEKQSECLKGLELCYRYYETYKEALLKDFKEYKAYMAFGMVGDGSECLGFDDELSCDHDFGPGFCIFLPRTKFKEIGSRLQQAYDSLPKEFMGYKRENSVQGKSRVGVKCIEDFYMEYIGCEDIPKTETEWLYAKPERYLAATGGEVFEDNLGEFTRIRNGLLQFYQEDLRRKMLATELAMMAQTGQYNYERMLKRGEKVTVQLILYKYMEHTMNAVYLLNRKYAPFYKWKHRGMSKLEILPEVMDILNAIADMEYADERIPQVIEIIAKLIVHELNEQGLTQNLELYLDAQAGEVINSISKVETTVSKRGEAGNVKEKALEQNAELVEQIVDLEWKAFDKVENEGGRAGCQDDYTTFSIMRKSQYMTWTKPMLESYLNDFEYANANGINLITQKYGYMMESTAPERFAEIKDRLQPVAAEKRQLIDQIVSIQVGFMEAFAERYPLAASNARSIHSSEDNLFNTSYETYLRGELMTYSDETLMLYGRFIVEKANTGSNLAKEIMNHTAELYGYESVDDLEAKLKKHL